MTNPQPYYYAQPAAPAAPKGLSITGFVLGIVSLFFGFTFLMPIAGLIFSIVGLKKEPAAKAFSITGIVLNAVALVSWLFIVILFVVIGGSIFAVLLGVAATNPSYNY